MCPGFGAVLPLNWGTCMSFVIVLETVMVWVLKVYVAMIYLYPEDLGV